MNFRNVLHVIAWLLAVIAVGMALCGGVSWLYAEPRAAWMSLLKPAGLTLLLALPLGLLTRTRRELSRRDGLGIVAFGWLIAGMIGGLPYLFAGLVPDFASAAFESISGMTTTGASVLSNLETVPRGLLLWRALTQYIGGMGVLILVVAILPFAGAGGMQLFRAEMPGPSKDRIEPRVASTAKCLWGVYIGLTILLALLLRVSGMNTFDAICHALATMATGGFSTRSASIAAWNSPLLEGILIVFMLLAGINFSLHYRLLRGETLVWWKDRESRGFLLIFAGSTLLTAGLVVHAQAADGWGSALRQTTFTCSSIMTSTGFTTADYEQWPSLAKGILVVLMLVGGCAGSTAGGIKLGRIMVLAKAVLREIRLFMQPQAVLPIRMGRKSLEDPLLLSIFAFLVLFMLILLAGVLAMLPFTPDVTTAISSVITSMGNVGPGFSAVGPTSNFAALPAIGKTILALLMLAGRLELYTLLAILVPAFWRK